ncbi:MAG: hypothetical protein ACI85I_002696, partial [Arenicella sp.]
SPKLTIEPNNPSTCFLKCLQLSMLHIVWSFIS